MRADELNEEIALLERHIIQELLDEFPSLRITDDGEYFTDYFSVGELRCKCLHCKGEKPHKIPPEKLDKLNEFRIAWGLPFTPNSAYRCEFHPKELKKDKVGEHTRGAMDVPLRGGAQRFLFVKIAMRLGATGIGVANTFGHIDFRDSVPMVWKY